MSFKENFNYVYEICTSANSFQTYFKLYNLLIFKWKKDPFLLTSEHGSDRDDPKYLMWKHRVCLTILPMFYYTLVCYEWWLELFSGI